MIGISKPVSLWPVGICVLFPLFLQLDGGIYNRDYAALTDSQGVLTRLPLPISLLACFAVLIYLPGNLKRIHAGFVMIAGVVLVSVISLWLAGDGATSPQRKLLLMIQILLPLAGLLLGQLINDQHETIARAFLLVLSIVVPSQLLATWFQGGGILTHYLYIFSIYSHFQYVTLIFVCAFMFCLTSLWDRYRTWLCVIGAIMLVYSVSGLSYLTIFAYFAFVFTFVFLKFLSNRSHFRLITLSIILIICTMWGSYTYYKNAELIKSSVTAIDPLLHGKFKDLLQGKIPPNVQERLGDWKLFGNAIMESGKTLLVGHAQPVLREIRSSPHNFYIDVTYTFGVLGLFPMLGLMGYTAYLCFKQRKSISAETWWLVAIVLYLVVIDSNFKVTLRQPYPGIFTFFLWGILLSRLRLHAVQKLVT